ncbi:MAG: hypothetical protein EAY75_02730, partial [Bacteroidetes bacterium]
RRGVGRKLGWRAYAPLALVLAQVVLGIASVLYSSGIVPNRWGAFEWMAQLHQLTGMLLLLSVVYLLFATRPLATSTATISRQRAAMAG